MLFLAHIFLGGVFILVGLQIYETIMYGFMDETYMAADMRFFVYAISVSLFLLIPFFVLLIFRYVLNFVSGG